VTPIPNFQLLWGHNGRLWFNLLSTTSTCLYPISFSLFFIFLENENINKINSRFVFSNCRSKIPFLSFLSLLFFPLVLLFPFLAFYSPGKYQSRFSREKHSTLNTGLISFPNFPPMLSPSHCHRSILLIPPILVSAHAVFSFLFCIFSRSRVLAFLISEWTDVYYFIYWKSMIASWIVGEEYFVHEMWKLAKYISMW
jgi:hypothetical protein